MLHCSMHEQARAAGESKSRPEKGRLLAVLQGTTAAWSGSHRLGAPSVSSTMTRGRLLEAADSIERQREMPALV